jgi:hypothetical protein
MQVKHKVPIHMSLPDRVVFGLTTRQFLLLLLGCSVGYNFWLHVALFATFGFPGQIVRVGIALVPVGIVVGVAFISVAGRPLEIWFLVLVRYWQRPHLYLWRSVRLQQQHVDRGYLAAEDEDRGALVTYPGAEGE